MYIDPIHAGHVAQAHAFALAARASRQCGSAPLRRLFKSLMCLAQWSRQQDIADFTTAKSVQQMRVNNPHK